MMELRELALKERALIENIDLCLDVQPCVEEVAR